jgi:nitrate reductase beta subunit
LTPTIPVIEQARKDGIPDAWMVAARNSPVYKMAVDWKVALPLHPEYRTLPMVWYVPPLSPIQAAANVGHLTVNGEIPDVKQMRIPVKYLANLLTAGDTFPSDPRAGAHAGHARLHAQQTCGWRRNDKVLAQVAMDKNTVEDMYHVMAIANYEDRFVIPAAHREYAENAFDCVVAAASRLAMAAPMAQVDASLFGTAKKRTIPIKAEL